METIASCIIILAFLFIIYQIVLLIIYFKPFILDKTLKRKKSWNPYYDPTFTILLISFCFITIGFTYVLVSNNTLTDSSIIFYSVLILLINTFFSLIFFNRKKLIQRKTIEQRQYELDEKKEIAKIEQLELKQQLAKERVFEEKKNIRKKLNNLEKLQSEGINLLNDQDKKNSLNNIIITNSLKKTMKVSAEEIIEKLTLKKSLPEKKDLPNYNSFFNQTQLNYLWANLRKYEIIDDNYNKEDFCKNFLINKIIINLKPTSLYHFHKKIRFIIDAKLELTTFVHFFKDELNNDFDYNVVKNGSQRKKHDLFVTFENIFNAFPK